MPHPSAPSLRGAATVFVVKDVLRSQLCFGMESKQPPTTQ
jgi:hypothetical protein